MYLFADDSNAEWFSSLRLHLPPWQLFQPMPVTDKRDGDTTMELLKTPERHWHPEDAASVNRRLWKEANRMRRRRPCFALECGSPIFFSAV